MAFPILRHHCKNRMNKVPLPMERADTHNDNEHIIDVASSSHERPSSGLEQQHGEDLPSTSSRTLVHQPSLFSTGSNSSHSSIRRANSRGRQRSPLDSVLWISVEFALTVSQIIAAIVVLCLSKHEEPSAPLKAWIIGYASGCAAILPLLYWRFINLERASQPQQDVGRSSNASPLTGRVVDGENRQTTDMETRSTLTNQLINPRLKALVEYFKMALDCFFAVWFVVGNVWIFGGHSSSGEAPNVYRLCIVFLTFSCIGYAMPFILCTTICCCLPCIISVLGYRQDFIPNRGATQDVINALPTYKFKAKKHKSGNSSSGAGEGGLVAAGTEKERAISEEDAVCCICLGKFANKDKLRELPCAHFFHKECVDKWLKINATCPLCKAEVGQAQAQAQAQTPVALTLQNTIVSY